MINSNLKYVFLFIGLMAAQILFLNGFVAFDYGFCFIYVAFIILLPIETPRMLLLVLGLVAGLTVDIFSNTLGINAAATVFIAYLRPYILNLITPRGGYDLNFEINLFGSGWQWFAGYSFIMIFIHHLTLFTIEAASFSFILNILLRTIFSSALTFLVLVFGELIFTVKR